MSKLNNSSNTNYIIIECPKCNKKLNNVFEQKTIVGYIGYSVIKQKVSHLYLYSNKRFKLHVIILEYNFESNQINYKDLK